MRKIIFIFVLLSCFSAGFADTGYRGHEWYSYKNTFPLTAREDFNEINYNTLPFKDSIVYQKTIAGSKEFLFYFFDYETTELIAAGYSIPASKTSKLKEQIPTKELVFFAYDFSEFDFPKEGTPIKKEFYYLLEFELLIEALEARVSESADIKITLGGNGKISYYDYNDDTRCYIFENAVPDRTVVIYVPHEQDF